MQSDGADGTAADSSWPWDVCVLRVLDRGLQQGRAVVEALADRPRGKHSPLSVAHGVDHTSGLANTCFSSRCSAGVKLNRAAVTQSTIMHRCGRSPTLSMHCPVVSHEFVSVSGFNFDHVPAM